MRPLVSRSRYIHVGLNAGRLFWARHYLSCTVAADVLWDRIKTMDYIAAVDINRYRQFVGGTGIAPRQRVLPESVERRIRFYTNKSL